MAKPFVPTPQSVDALAHGKATLYLWGEPASRKLNRRELLEYETAKFNHYVVTRSWAAANTYFCWCECDPPVPFVHVRPASKYAAVTMDCITTGGRIPDEEIDLVLRLFKQAGAPPTCYTSVGMRTHCAKVPLESAERVAATLWAIGTAPRRAPPEADIEFAEPPG